jgi:CPA1 family monovalent cation:H+ antiporter
MSDRTREHLDTFWELIDEILNAVLFVLIGLEVIPLKFTGPWLKAGFVAIPVLLIARWVSVVLPIGIMRSRRKFNPGAVTILTWSGLRRNTRCAGAFIAAGNRKRCDSGNHLHRRDFFL